VDTLLGELENLTRQRTELLVAQRTSHEQLLAETRRRLRAERRLSNLRERCGCAVEQLLAREAAVAAELQAAYELLAERASAGASAGGPLSPSSAYTYASEATVGTAEAAVARTTAGKTATHAKLSALPSSGRVGVMRGAGVSQGVASGVGFGFDALGQSISIGDVLHDGEDGDGDSDAEMEALLAPASVAAAAATVTFDAAPGVRRDAYAGEGPGSGSPRHSPARAAEEIVASARAPSPPRAPAETPSLPVQALPVGALPVEALAAAPIARRPLSPSASSLARGRGASVPAAAAAADGAGSAGQPVEPLASGTGAPLSSYRSSWRADGSRPPSLAFTHHWTSGQPGTPDGERALAAQLPRGHRQQRAQAHVAASSPHEPLQQVPLREPGRGRRPASASAARAPRRRLDDDSPEPDDWATTTGGRGRGGGSDLPRGQGAARDAALAAAVARDRVRVAQKVAEARSGQLRSLRTHHLHHATAGLARHPVLAASAGPHVRR
jgi:hypothetical protein